MGFYSVSFRFSNHNNDFVDILRWVSVWIGPHTVAVREQSINYSTIHLRVSSPESVYFFNAVKNDSWRPIPHPSKQKQLVYLAFIAELRSFLQLFMTSAWWWHCWEWYENDGINTSYQPQSGSRGEGRGKYLVITIWRPKIVKELTNMTLTHLSQVKVRNVLRWASPLCVCAPDLHPCS